MSGQITPVLTHVASGFLQGQGLAVNAEMLSAINVFRTSGISGAIRSVLSQQNIEDAAPGVTAALYALPFFITARDNSIDLTAAIEQRANRILPGGTTGLLQFAGTLGQATSFISTSFQWKGSMAELGSKSFGDFGLGIENISDMASFGASKVLAAPTGTASLDKVSTSFNNLGQLYDTSNMSTLGQPANLINQINSLGLSSVGRLDEKLIAVGVTNIDEANPVVLKQVLSTITGPDLAKIIEISGAKVGNQVQTAADLLDASKALPNNLGTALPGGSFAGLGNAMINLGGRYSSPAMAASYLSRIEVPNFPRLNSITTPVPTEVAQQITANLGSGSGPFATPTLMEMIGTVAGYKHTEAFEFSNEVQQQLLDSDSGIEFSEAIDNLQFAITAGDPVLVTEAVQEITAVVSDINNSASIALAELVGAANEKMLASKNQLTLETTNLLASRIGAGSAMDFDISVGLPITTVDTQSVLNFATQFHTFGVDRQKIGYNDLFTKIAANDLYGDAVQVALIEGRALENQALIGIQNVVQADPTAYLKSTQGSSGSSDDSEWYRGS